MGQVKRPSVVEITRFLCNPHRVTGEKAVNIVRFFQGCPHSFSTAGMIYQLADHPEIEVRNCVEYWFRCWMEEFPANAKDIEAITRKLETQ